MRRLLLCLCLVLAAGLAQAQQPWNQAQIRQWFDAGQFGEIESTYARVLAARTRNRWGEFQTEEILRVLTVPTSTATTASLSLLEEKAQDWWSRDMAPLACIVRATLILRRLDLLGRSAPWTAVEAQVRDAAGLLVQAQAASTRDPNWHAAQLEVARLEGWEDARLWPALRAATRAEPWALSPYLAALRTLAEDNRQGLERTLEMAAYALSLTSASEGSSMYARIMLRAPRWFQPLRSDPFAAGHIQWPLMHQGLKDLEARYPGIYPLNHHAALACLAGDKGATTLLLGRVGAQPVAREWEFWGGKTLHERCKTWIQMPDQPPAKVASKT
ncbi:MAG: hypothetical protein EOO25_11615 [Comamonadaceae bacterium]|nr:MAG: hypothetical protein EOO25_11615 [Comamonadaceae bacterium]